MLALTLISQFGIIPRMDALRASIGEIDSAPADHPARVQFDALHHWSTRIESGVMLLGLVVAYLTRAVADLISAVIIFLSLFRFYENWHHWPAAGRQDLSVPDSHQGASFRPGYANPREAHIGVAKVPDERLDRLAALYNPKKLTHASVEYVDVGAIGQEALKESAYVGHLRNVDALAHVVRAFDDPSIPHVGPVDPLRDIKNVDFDLMVSDLGQIEKRLERLEKDLKKMRTPELEKEFDLLKRANAHLGTERPLREMEMTPEDKKRLRGFMFLSEKPILYVLNVGESTELGNDLENAIAQIQSDRSGLAPQRRRVRHLRKSGSGTCGNERRRCGRVPGQLWAERKRTGPPDSHHLHSAGADFIFHRRRRRMPRLDDSRPHPRGGSCRRHPFRSGEALHSR